MRWLILTTPEQANGVWYFDHGLARGLQLCNQEVVIKPQVRPGNLDWYQPEIVLMRLHKFMDYDVNMLDKAREGGALIGAWLSPWLPKKYQHTEEQRDLHPERHLYFARDCVDFGLTWWGKDAYQELYQPWKTKFDIPTFQMDPAADTHTYRPAGVSSRGTTDLAFIGGNTWEKRRVRTYLEPLLRRHSYFLSGKGWKQRRFHVSDIEPQKEPKIYAQAKVCPNIHHEMVFEIPGMAPNQRLFQLAACQAFQVVDAHPRLSEWFNPDEMVSADTEAEYHERVEFWLHDEKGRRKMAQKAYRRVQAHHTFAIRAKALIASVKELR